MRVGIFGGSFNPIHNGHIALAEGLLDKLGLDEVWLMVSPQNPLKASSSLLDDELRLRLVKEAVKGHPRLKACDYEFHLPKPSYTWTTLQALNHDYPDHQFTLLIGGDNWEHFSQWAHADDIIANYDIAVYPRRGFCSEECGVRSEECLAQITPHSSLHTPHFVKMPLLDISSTMIREKIAKGEDISDLVPFNPSLLTTHYSLLTKKTLLTPHSSLLTKKKLLTTHYSLLTKINLPIRTNFLFFVFMFLLGYIAYRLQATQGKLMEEQCSMAAKELFVDIYALCVVLTLIPRKIRRWVRALICLVVYPVFIVDMYCFTKFGTSLNPTMLLLVGETNSGEASEFLHSYLHWNILATSVGTIIYIAIAHLALSIVWALRHKLRIKPLRAPLPVWLFLEVLAIAFCIVGINDRWDNKVAFHRLMSYDTVGEIEHELTRKDKAELYTPIYRLAFSIYANRLAAKQIDNLVAATRHIDIDTCEFRSRNIVLIIGESYNRHHAQLYGYGKKTTPRQSARAKKGELVAFSDVVAPWNLTSFVFKNLFSMHCVGDSGEWCDYPLFPEIFKKAGYKVTFLTNQYISKPKEAVYDFSGGFFLNNPTLSDAMFDVRNDRMYRYDDGIIGCYDKLVKDSVVKPKDGNNLIILHLKGQHVWYKERCPKQLRQFEYTDYDTPSLDKRSRMILADYDNATLYNDFIVNEIIKRFEKEDAIIVYVPDHGEECFGGGLRVYGRLHSATVDYRLAHEEFEVPFWIWCSKKYRRSHRNIFRSIRKSQRKPLMTDRLAHTLLYMAGIETTHYDERRNILSSAYDATAPRILKGTADYDQLRTTSKAE